MGRYTDRVALITGAGRGLGEAMARRFAAEGASVALADLNPDTVNQVADSTDTGHVTAAVVDVADREAVEDWVQDTHRAFGRIDILVNNAGILRDSRIEAMTDKQWHDVIDVHLGGMFHATRAVFPHMTSAGYGRILSISSVSWRGQFGQANYSAAKAGIVGLTRTLGLEGARHGITANALAPGIIHTSMWDSLSEPARKRLLSRVPVGHIGQPTDIAEAAAFLCSEAARYITGVVLDVDGGMSITGSLT